MRLFFAIPLAVAIAIISNNPAVEAAVSQCIGFEDAPMQVTGGDSPDVIYIPSTFEMSTVTVLAEDLPSDLKMGLQLTMTDPFPLEVPCIDGLGSWYVYHPHRGGCCYTWAESPH